MSYSETRFTKDIDLMFEGGETQIAELISAVESLQIYVDPLDTVLEFNLPKQLPINVLDGSYGTRADLYIARSYGLDQTAMSRRRERLMYNNPILNAWYLSPEDVILYKLDYFKQSEGVSQKHPIDIAKMLGVLGDQLDFNYLDHWAQTLGVLDLWHALLQEFRK